MATTELSPRNQLRTALIEKCWKDPEFRTQVIADPKNVYEKATGNKLPENINIVIHEEDANTIHFSIPPAPEHLTELSDEDLERVAGGTEVVGSISLVMTLVTTTVVASGAASALGTARAMGKSSPW
jgi:hypothetical protein